MNRDGFPMDTETKKAKPARGKAIFKTLLKVVVSGALLYFLYRDNSVRELTKRIQAVNPFWLILGFVFLFLNTFLSSLKWRVLLCADGIHLSLWRLFSSHLTGSFFSLFLPSTIGGDAYRIADIGQSTSKAARTAASVLVDRMTGFFALAIYGLVASFSVRHHIPNWDNKFFIFPVVALGVVVGFGAALCMPKFVRWCYRLIPGAKLRRRVEVVSEQILDAVQEYLKKAATGIKVLVLSFLFQLDVILFVWAVTKAIGLVIPFWTFFLFVPFITLMEMIPISVFGIGLRDVGYQWFLGAVGSESANADAATISFYYVTMTILYVSIGGILFIFRKSQKKRK